MAIPPRESGLYTSAADKLARAGVADTNRASVLAEIEAAIRDVVYPAYGRLIGRMSAHEPAAGTDAGAWHLPDGDAYYAWALRHHTTSGLPSDSVHALGLAEAERIGVQMHALLDSMGVRRGNLAERLRRLEARPGKVFIDTRHGEVH